MDGANGDRPSEIMIGTHNGTFHCDEVLACYLLKQLNNYKNARIVRSRNPEVLADCAIIVDVGGVYDPDKKKFDHHQRSFHESMNSLNANYKWTTKLSSAGLVYYHFGKEALTSLILPQVLDEKTLDVVYTKMYEGFVEEVDAVDNGIMQYEGEPRYYVSSTLSSRVSRKNPSWNEKDLNEHELFMNAMDMVGSEFRGRLLGLINNWLPARDLVEDAVNGRFQVHKSGQIMELKQFCPWKEHLFDIEESISSEDEIKYVLYSDSNGNARVQCVPKGRNTFENRLSLPQEWAGLRDNELTAVCGIADCIFVHANGFIGGNRTREGALSMAIKSLALQQNK